MLSTLKPLNPTACKLSPGLFSDPAPLGQEVVATGIFWAIDLFWAYQGLTVLGLAFREFGVKALVHRALGFRA